MISLKNFNSISKERKIAKSLTRPLCKLCEEVKEDPPQLPLALQCILLFPLCTTVASPQQQQEKCKLIPFF